MNQKLSEYRIMWVLVFFDLPVGTAKERKAASKFRIDLLKDGFSMFQFSIYARHCNSRENMEVHRLRVRALLRPRGFVCIAFFTDKQFGGMELYHGGQSQKNRDGSQQLTLF